ncbi:hypothetical protein [Devosia alba]|uniref:hypothetical protein n=1 Tax=Devosia alba TaxID=3152360 RepID=UPI0032667D38
MSKLTKAQRAKIEVEISQAERMSDHYALEAKALRIKLSRDEHAGRAALANGDEGNE